MHLTHKWLTDNQVTASVKNSKIQKIKIPVVHIIL